MPPRREAQRHWPINALLARHPSSKRWIQVMGAGYITLVRSEQQAVCHMTATIVSEKKDNNESVSMTFNFKRASRTAEHIAMRLTDDGNVVIVSLPSEAMAFRVEEYVM